MEFIARHRLIFTIVSIIAAGLSLFTTVIGPKYGFIVQGTTTPQKLALLLLPSFVFFAAFMPLVYYAWLYVPGNATFHTIKKGVFWLMSVGVTLVWGFFIWAFLLQ